MQSSSFMVCGCQGWWRSDGPGPEPFHLSSNKNEADPAFCRDVCKPALCKMQNSLRLDKVKHKPHLFNLASERHVKAIILYFIQIKSFNDSELLFLLNFLWTKCCLKPPWRGQGGATSGNLQMDFNRQTMIRTHLYHQHFHFLYSSF